MIYLGDVAHPFSAPPAWATWSQPWRDQRICLNFEGAFFDSTSVPLKGVGNHVSLGAFLRDRQVVAFLANNHIFDDASAACDTLDTLGALGVPVVGAGRSAFEAESHCVVREGDREIVVLAFGWRTIGCRSRSASRLHLNELSGSSAIAHVARARKAHPKASVHVVIHWNYELELYPQPGHRVLARELILAGADAVIGHHPHLVAGVEWVNGKPVFYSLGNWWVPQGVFEGGSVRYPEESYTQLALEFRANGVVVAHWYTYDPGSHQLRFEFTEEARESRRLRELTPFDGFSDSEYVRWFPKNRRKRKLLPIVKRHASPVQDSAIEAFVWLRHQGLMAVEKLGLRRRRGM